MERPNPQRVAEAIREGRYDQIAVKHTEIRAAGVYASFEIMLPGGEIYRVQVEEL
jgi:predicted aminopeptidase